MTTKFETGHDAEMAALEDYDNNWTPENEVYVIPEQTLIDYRILFGITSN